MRIVRFLGENVKRLKLVDITPNKYINRLSGANGSGKTSILDAIEWVLVNKPDVPTYPVRKGAGTAIIRVKLEGGEYGELTITRKITEGATKNGGVLVIEDKDGKRFPSSAAILKTLLQNISFDPLEFIRMAPKEQFNVLSHIAAPDVDLEAMEQEEADLYMQRKVAKKERDDQAGLRDMIHVPADLPEEKYDEDALVRELQEASEYNAGINEERNRRERHRSEIDVLSRAMNSRDERMEQLRAEISRLVTLNSDDAEKVLEMETDATTWDELAQPKDAAELAEKISNARTINKAIERAQQRAAIDKQVNDKDKHWKELDEALDRVKRNREEAVRNAKFPVPGLGFGVGEVLYNNLPLNQASNGEAIRVSAAIGMAGNPQLRVMTIRDGALLDKNSLDVIAELAHQHDFQVWIEATDTTGKVGVYLEDGAITTTNEEPLDAPKPAKKAAAKKPPKKATATA